MSLRDEWVKQVRVRESEPHKHEWQVCSGSTDGYLAVYCWCGAQAWQTFSGNVGGIIEPTPEARFRAFEIREWEQPAKLGLTLLRSV